MRLLSSKAQGYKDSLKTSKPCQVSIHWIALIENSQMSTTVPGFQPFFSSFFLHYFVLAELATSSIRVKRSGDPAQTGAGVSMYLFETKN